MFFCEKCRYLFNITKEIKGKQLGGKINDALNSIFEKFSKNQKINEKDISKITAKDITDDERFEAMNKKDQKKLISQIKEINNKFFVEEVPVEGKVGSNVAYFICKFCKNHKSIKPGTLIYSKSYNTSTSIETEDYTYAIYDQTLVRTKNYICPNKKCESHKNDDVREAVITKNINDQAVYVCTSCSTHWVNAF